VWDTRYEMALAPISRPIGGKRMVAAFLLRHCRQDEDLVVLCLHIMLKLTHPSVFHSIIGGESHGYEPSAVGRTGWS
jgi:hypothetical protein